jgi:Phage integrase family
VTESGKTTRAQRMAMPLARDVVKDIAISHGGCIRPVQLRRTDLATGLPSVHFHDLRHSGNQLAADAGASLRELMDRMGHSTTQAAMVYLHGSDQRQQAIADALSERAARELGRPKTRRSGTQRARRRRSAS